MLYTLGESRPGCLTALQLTLNPNGSERLVFVRPNDTRWRCIPQFLPWILVHRSFCDQCTYWKTANQWHRDNNVASDFLRESWGSVRRSWSREWPSIRNETDSGNNWYYPILHMVFWINIVRYIIPVSGKKTHISYAGRNLPRRSLTVLPLIGSVAANCQSYVCSSGKTLQFGEGVARMCEKSWTSAYLFSCPCWS